MVESVCCISVLEVWHINYLPQNKQSLYVIFTELNRSLTQLLLLLQEESTTPIPPPINLTATTTTTTPPPPKATTNKWRWILNAERRCHARASRRIRHPYQSSVPDKGQVQASGLTPPSKLTRVVSRIGASSASSNESNVLERLFADVASLSCPEHSVITKSLLHMRSEIRTLMTSSSQEQQQSHAIPPTTHQKLTMTIENITSSNHLDLNTLSDARGFLMYVPFLTVLHSHTHTHTHTYIYIYIIGTQQADL